MKIVRNATAWRREAHEGTYLVVNSIAHDPTYFLTEVFIRDGSQWRALLCAPIHDQRVLSLIGHLESFGNGEEVALPQDLPESLGRKAGESWVQFRSQQIASWGPGSTRWQRLKHRVFG